MSYARFAPFKLSLSRALLLAALPLACAAEVKPEFQDNGETNLPADTAGASAGGTKATAGSSSLPTAGTTTSAGGSVTSNPFGGTSSSGGTSSGGTSSGGTSSGGTSSGGSSAGGSGGNATAGKGGSGGAAGSSTGGGSGGTGTGSCACPTKKIWADNTNLAFGPGDCVDVAGAIYLYTGTKAQTWANKDCNPTKQLAWCSDVGADYKFMLCK